MRALWSMKVLRLKERLKAKKSNANSKSLGIMKNKFNFIDLIANHLRKSWKEIMKEKMLLINLRARRIEAAMHKHHHCAKRMSNKTNKTCNHYRISKRQLGDGCSWKRKICPNWKNNMSNRKIVSIASKMISSHFRMKKSLEANRNMKTNSSTTSSSTGS